MKQNMSSMLLFLYYLFIFGTYITAEQNLPVLSKLPIVSLAPDLKQITDKSINGVVMYTDDSCNLQTTTSCDGLSSCFNIACKYFNKSANVNTVIGFNPTLCDSMQIFKTENIESKTFNGAIIVAMNSTCSNMGVGNKCTTIESCYSIMCEYQLKYLFPSKITFISPYVCDF